MPSPAFLSTPPTTSVLDRRRGGAKNRLLNLAFEDGNTTCLGTDGLEEPKSVPADVFKQGFVTAFGSCTLETLCALNRFRSQTR